MPKFRMNHMELTLPEGKLGELRADIVAFYGEIFGFKGRDIPFYDTVALGLAADEEASQFLLIVETKDYLQAPGYDHLGFIFETSQEIDELLETCKAWQRKDPRVQIKEYEDLVMPETITHAFYVRYLLPIWFDIQYIQHRSGFEPKRRWAYVPV